MDAALQSVIESAVDDKVSNGDMFTAFDVTREVWARGHKERHNNMKEAVHAYYASGRMGADYTRTFVVIPGTQLRAWLYHRHTDNPRSYQAGDPAVVKKAVASQVAGFYAQGQAPAPPPDDDGTGSVQSPPPVSLLPVQPGLRRPDARGTICVRATVLRAAGFKPKDQVAVWQNGTDSLEIRGLPSPDPFATPVQPLARYTVNSHNNVRITKHVLQTITAPAGGYEFEGDTHKVLVKAK